ncbi:bifunctional aldolase/short-chain dehydrogenase [Myxococcota bacterium]|nr:bifunctional aldolase/short-chain dehydrogenase [Myxococcota bacterium]
MKSLWNEAEANEFVNRFSQESNREIAIRTYTSRLLGRDASLVLHGGGNTSVKTVLPDRVTGEPIEVLCVKGSGWDLVDLEPPGLPAVRLDALRRLRGVERLGDEEMVNQIRTQLLDLSSPTPSVETLLHAFLPHRFVDHTHADAILVLTNQADGDAKIREAMGDEVPLLPWIMPGHPLAEAVADIVEDNPGCPGVVLLHHGIFTFGAEGRESYERMITLCDRAERFAARTAASVPPMLIPAGGAQMERAPEIEKVLPVIRGALAVGSGESIQRFVCDLRNDPDLIAFSRHPDAPALISETGPLTPDHVIRTKAPYLFVRAEEAESPEAVRQAVGPYAERYRSYFEENENRLTGDLVMLDPHPRVVVVEGVGLLAFGPDAKAAAVAGDLAEQTLRAKALAQAVGEYDGLPPGELFEMEYWALEQAKLGKKTPPLLAGQIALVTGAGGAIGCGIAEELLSAGAHLVVTDRDGDRLEVVRERLEAKHGASRLHAVEMDVTNEASVEAAFGSCVQRFGGLDLLVPNAGIAHVSPLSEMNAEAFRRVVDVNLTGTMLVIRAAAQIFERQGTGGNVVVQASKNVFAPGAGFGAYSASKAGAAQIAKVAALELAPIGVRVNSINADAVFGDDEVSSGLWDEVGPDRMRSRGLDPDGLRAFYRERSLLKVAVTPAHVGRAVLFFASSQTPTTGAVLPVDGGVAEAFPR